MRDINEFQGRDLVHTLAPCTSKRHFDISGGTIKIRGQRCLACKCDYPPGFFTHNLTNIAPYEYRGKYTPEEKKQVCLASSKKWNEANKEKTAEYRKEYYRKNYVRKKK